jgi:hypothetical protein
MTQHDYNGANASGATYRADLNSLFQAIAENNSGASTPSTTFAYQLWADTTTGHMKIRNAANSAWITMFLLSTAGMIQGADIVSGTALPVLADGVFNDVTGTTTITSINALGIGTLKILQFDAIVTVTHHATNLILPSATNIVTVAGQVLTFYEYASGDWRLVANSVPAAAGGNKRDFVQAHGVYSDDDLAGIGNLTTLMMRLADGVTLQASGNWKVPSDFVSLTSIEAIWSSSASSGNAYLKFDAAGTNAAESISTGGEVDGIAVTTYATGAANVLEYDDVTAMANGLSFTAKDMISLVISRQGGDGNDTLSAPFDFMGFLITYA